MAYSIKHVTTFRYHPAVGESVMEVRMQPRSDMRQRCITFSLDVNPRANVMTYRDFFGNAVHHFVIPGRHELIEVTAHAIVDINPAAWPAVHYGTWEDLDARVAEGDYWEMLLPSQYAKPTDLLAELSVELKLERRGAPPDLLMELKQARHDKIDYAPDTTKEDSPIHVAFRGRSGGFPVVGHIMIA